MKTRLPKMLLAAVLAAMTSAYALPEYVKFNPEESPHQYYFGGEYDSPNVITEAEGFGSGISDVASSTVNIGYGDKDAIHNGYFTLKDGTFTTPNALFIGGPGWPHTLTEGYQPSEGSLTVDGAVLYVGTNIQMGTCSRARSYLEIVNGGKVYAGHMEVSNGGGVARVFVGGGTGAGELHLTGNLGIGVNNVSGDRIMDNFKMAVRDGGEVTVAGTTSVGYATVNYPGALGMLEIHHGGEMRTASLEMGIGMMHADSPVIPSSGRVSVAGTLNVTGLEIAPGALQDTIIGINGGEGILRVENGGQVNLGEANVILGATSVSGDTTHAELIVDELGTLTHNGTMYVGDWGTESKETGESNYGIGELNIGDEAVAELNRVEVSKNSRIFVTGTLTVDETVDTYGVQGVRLYDGAILAGSPDNRGGKLTFSVVPENPYGTEVVIDKFTLTEGTTLKACCNTHLTVDSGSKLTFGDGTLWLTDGIAFIDGGLTGAGTITANGGEDGQSGFISVAGNEAIKYWLDTMGSEKSGSVDKVALIDADDFLDKGGIHDDILADGTLKLDRPGFEIRFSDTDEGVFTMNEGEGFRGFYVAKTEYSAEEAYPSFNRNQRAVYELIKQLEDSPMPLPEELRQRIEEVLNTNGSTDEGKAKIQEALDFLGAVNYSVMMHNQIEGNLSHQRLLRNRSMVGRNLRHAKGCTDVYAAGFYDTQRLKGDRSSGEGYRRNEWGGLVGADTCINQNLRLGADVALGWSRISPSHNMKLHQNSLYWDVYAMVRKGNWRSITALGMGIHNFKVERSGFDGITAKKDHVRGLSLNISEEVTYDWKVNEKTTIQPFAAVDLNWNRIKAFTDATADPARQPLGVHVAKQDAFVAEFTLGGRYIRDFALLRNVPDATWYAQLGVNVTAGDVDSDLDCNFVGTPGQHFTVDAAERDRVGLDLGTGITIPVTENCAIYANGEAILRGDSHNINAQLGVQVAF